MTFLDYCRTLRKGRSIKASTGLRRNRVSSLRLVSGTSAPLKWMGRNRKLYCFFYILAHSRLRYVEFITDIRTQSLIKLHLDAFRYTGGITS